MDPITVGYIGVAALIFFVFVGVPVAYASAFTGIVGMIYIRGFNVATGLAGLVPFASSASYSLSVLPLFIAIGFLAMHAGITTSAFNAARIWVGRSPGGLATATIFASAGFAAVSGASTASTAVFTRLAIPEMEKRGYSQQLAAGVVAVGGTLAALIPPSAILVLYGILVEESIADLLMAGLIPGKPVNAKNRTNISTPQMTIKIIAVVLTVSIKPILICLNFIFFCMAMTKITPVATAADSVGVIQPK